MISTTKPWQRAVVIAQQIESLQRELDSILGGGFSSSSAPAKRGRKPKEISFAAEPVEAKPERKKRRKLSPAALEAIREGQRKRWAKAKGGKAAPKAEKPEADQPAKKGKKRKMSPEALERIREAQKKRWAAFHKAQKAGK